MLRPNKPESDPKRERLRYAIAKAWRKAGRSWTSAEMEAAIDAALAQQTSVCRRPVRPPADPSPKPGHQLELPIDSPSPPKKAHADAPQSRSNSARRAAIEAHVRRCRENGATRHEIAESLGFTVQGVCQPVVDLLKAGRLIKTRKQRKSAVGGRGFVLVVPGYEQRGEA